MEKQSLFRQGWKFTVISGIGWLIDFFVYTCLSIYVNIPVTIANMISSLPAITFVFCFATSKIFAAKKSRVSLKFKYCIYLAYQVVLVMIVSMVAGWMYAFGVEILNQVMDTAYLKVGVKCLITPITMCCNFIFMKIILERL